MAGQAKVLRVDVSTFEKDLQAAFDDGFAYLDSIHTKSGETLIILHGRKPDTPPDLDRTCLSEDWSSENPPSPPERIGRHVRH
jgi:hypothetical protein